MISSLQRSGTVLLLLIFQFSCGRQKIDQYRNTEARTSSLNATAADSAFAIIKNPDLQILLHESRDNLAQENFSEESLWRLAECNCLPNTLGSLMKSWIRSRGTLPQLFAPNVREAVRNDTELNAIIYALSQLPDFLRSIVEGFISDSDISNAIRRKIVRMLDNALPTGTSLDLSVADFRFDHFLFPDTKSQNKPLFFSLQSQTPRWYAVMSAKNMWQDEQPINFEDHGLQLVNVMQTLSELQYVLGLAKTKEGRTLGGLAYDLETGINGDLRDFDLRTNKGKKGFVSGSFKVSYPDIDKIDDLIRDLREYWTPVRSPVSLKEQSQFWKVGASLLNNLRPNNREKCGFLFSEPEGVIPADAYGLGLIIVSTMADLLDGPFIDVDKKLIRANALVPGGHKPFNLREDEPASLTDLVALADVLLLWRTELINVDDLNLIDDETSNKLAKSPEIIDQVLRLIGQTILRDYLIEDKVTGKMEIDRLRRFTLSESLEAYRVLIKIEETALASPMLRKRIEKLFTSIVELKLGEKLETKAPFSSDEILELKLSFDRTSNSKLSIANHPEIYTFLSAINSVLENWDASVEL